MKILVGDFENALAINGITFLTKKEICNTMKKEPKRILNLKYETKNVYSQKKYRHYVKRKKSTKTKFSFPIFMKK